MRRFENLWLVLLAAVMVWTLVTVAAGIDWKMGAI